MIFQKSPDNYIDTEGSEIIPMGEKILTETDSCVIIIPIGE